MKRLLEEEWQGAVNFHPDSVSKADRHKGIINVHIQSLYNAWDRDIKNNHRHYITMKNEGFIFITSENKFTANSHTQDDRKPLQIIGQLRNDVTSC